MTQKKISKERQTWRDTSRLAVCGSKHVVLRKNVKSLSHPFQDSALLSWIAMLLPGLLQWTLKYPHPLVLYKNYHVLATDFWGYHRDICRRFKFKVFDPICDIALLEISLPCMTTFVTPEIFSIAVSFSQEMSGSTDHLLMVKKRVKYTNRSKQINLPFLVNQMPHFFSICSEQSIRVLDPKRNQSSRSDNEVHKSKFRRFSQNRAENNHLSRACPNLELVASPGLGINQTQEKTRTGSKDKKRAAMGRGGGRGWENELSK